MKEAECNHSKKAQSLAQLADLRTADCRGSWVLGGRGRLAKPQVYDIMVSQKDLWPFTYCNCALGKEEYPDIARIIGPEV